MSALQQTISDIEIIVVLDGPDPLTVELMNGKQDSRIKIEQLSSPSGASRARNIGVEMASADWVALLDDDDVWYPTKLELQLEAAKLKATEENRSVVVACRAMVISHRPYVLPRRVPDPGEAIADYLLVRKGLFHNIGFLQTSMILAPRQLLLEIPFRENLQRHQDTDWLIRAEVHGRATFIILNDVLYEWHLQEAENRVSQSGGWSHSLEWIMSIKNLISPVAYSSFIYTAVAAVASNDGDWHAFGKLLAEGRRGNPRALDSLLYLAMWLVKPALRQRIREHYLALWARDWDIPLDGR